MTANNTICVTGLGACTPVGLTAPAAAAAVRAGISGFDEHPYMINQEGEPYVLAMVPSIDATLTGIGRYSALVNSAIAEVLQFMQEISSNARKLAVIVGIPECRPGVPKNLATELTGQIKTMFGHECNIAGMEIIEKGHSASLMAIQRASKLLIAGKYQFCLAGGVDSYIDPDTLDWVENNDQLHSASNAWGFIPGEAAAFSLLCTKATARKFGLPIKAQLVNVHTAYEQNKIKSETVCIGKGLTEAVAEALAGLPNETKVSQTYCDQNGEAYRADEYGFMLARLSKHFANPSDYIAPADCWGDVGAASGSLFVNLLCAAAEKGYNLGPFSLLWTSSEDGERTAALIATSHSNKRPC